MTVDSLDAGVWSLIISWARLGIVKVKKAANK
jgi:hypothetical protein